MEINSILNIKYDVGKFEQKQLTIVYGVATDLKQSRISFFYRVGEFEQAILQVPYNINKGGTLVSTLAIGYNIESTTALTSDVVVVRKNEND